MIAGLSLTLVACNATPEENGNMATENTLNESAKIVEVENGNTLEKENNTTNNEAKETNNATSETEEAKDYSVSLTYPTTDYIVDGKEDQKFKKIETSISADENEIVEKVINQLATTPEGESVESSGLEKLTVNSTSFKDGVATVDFSSENLSGSSLDEEVVLSSIVNSLLSVDGIKKVEILIDGNTAETFMGHMDISQPFDNFIQ